MTKQQRELTLAELAGDRFHEQWDAGLTIAGFDTPRGFLRDVIVAIAEPIVASAAWTLKGAGGSAWEPLREPHASDLAILGDLRPSEAVELMRTLEHGVSEAEAECIRIINARLLEVVATFTATHPEATPMTPALLKRLRAIASA